MIRIVFPTRVHAQMVILVEALYHRSRFILFIHLFIHGKNSSGTINSNTMTNILKPKNPNPNIVLTYKDLISMNAVFKNYDREGV